MRKRVAWFGIAIAAATMNLSAQTVTGSGTGGMVPVFNGNGTTSTIGNASTLGAGSAQLSSPLVLQSGAPSLQDYGTVAWTSTNLSYAPQSWDMLSLINTDTGNDPYNFASIYFEANPSLEEGETTGRIGLVPEGYETYQSAFVFLPRGTSNSSLNEAMRISGSGNVGIGSMAPSNVLSVTPLQYNAGTAILSGTTVTGTGTSFSASMVGSQLTFASGISAGTITGVTNATTLTVSNPTNQATYPSGTPQQYAISYPGLQVASGGKVGIGTGSPQDLLDIQPSTDGSTSLLLSQQNCVTCGWSMSAQNDGVFRLFRSDNPPAVLSLVYNTGNVGIGTTSPAALLSVGATSQFTVSSTGGVAAPSVTFTGPNGGQQTTPWTGTLCGGDYAEAVDPAGEKGSYQPGDVLVIADGADDVRKSSEPYATTVAGIYATKPGVIGRRESLPKNGADLPMAMVGIVPTKVTAENGPIRKGDLLVSSSRPGYAMKGTDRGRMLGAVIGKAMGSLDSGTAVIEVLVTLQ